MPTDPPTRTTRPARPADEPDLLLELLRSLDQPVLVTFRPADDECVDVSVLDLPADPRAGAAALFGLRAPEGSTSAGVCLVGALPQEPEVRAFVAVADDGRVRARLDGVARTGPAGGAPRGLLVDAVHRVLGLASPGEPPMLWELALGWWARDVLDLLAADPGAGWAAAVDAHPGLAGAEQVPTARAIALATEEVVGDTSWSRLHQLASRGPAGLPDLAPGEAAWMDPTMFGRWLVGGLPSVEMAAGALAARADALPATESRRLRRLAARLPAAEAVLRSRSGLDTPSRAAG